MKEERAWFQSDEVRGIEEKKQKEEGRTFELLFGIEVDLLSLSDLFQDILDDDPVVDPYITKYRERDPLLAFR